jgi:hypothetical protein
MDSPILVTTKITKDTKLSIIRLLKIFCLSWYWQGLPVTSGQLRPDLRLSIIPTFCW